jgi:ADP-heptose:LPS heptosyltransferase
MEENDFEHFSQKTGINVLPLYKPASFEELCKIINSCKLFVGSLSMPLTIAHATHVDRIISLSGEIDDKLNIGLNIPNIVYEG